MRHDDGFTRSGSLDGLLRYTGAGAALLVDIDVTVVT